MTSEKPALLNKLILVVLSLILACLVLLVLRAYQKSSPVGEPPPVTEAVVPSGVEPAPAEPTLPAEVPTVHRPNVTNVLGAALLQRRSPPHPGVPPEALGAQPPALFDNSGAVIKSVTSELNAGGVRGAQGGDPAGSSPGLEGIITLVGRPKPEIPIDLGPSCGRLNPGPVTTRHFVVGPGGGLANVLVYLKDAQPRPAVGDGPLLDQVGCMFEPYVLGVVTGQRFSIRNSDQGEFHNVHATPKINREFNLGFPATTVTVVQKGFDQPEVLIRLKCDVHPWMFAYIGVVDHPYFAVSDTNGVFRLPAGFPAGTYTVSATHQKAGELTQAISIAEGERKSLRFEFTLP